MVIDEFLADAPLVFVRFAESLVRLATPILPDGEIDADRRFRELARTNLVSVGSRLNAEPALEPAVLVQAEHQGGFVIDDPMTRQLDQIIEGGVKSQSLYHDFVVIAHECEIKGKE